MARTRPAQETEITLDELKDEILRDYALCVTSREASLIGRKEVLGGKADVFVLDDILLKGLLANSSQADAYKLVILDESFGFEPYGLMLRKGDPEFKRIVDDTLLGLYRSGEIERIYAKWFQSAIPPTGINLDLSMGPELKQLIKTPNDRGI